MENKTLAKTNQNSRTISRTSVMNFWTRELNSGRETYRDESGEKNYTQMGEDAAEHFGVLSIDGQSDIEKDIFDWATELVF
jgi:hypothetical protein